MDMSAIPMQRRIQHPLRPLDSPPVKALAAAMAELCLYLSREGALTEGVGKGD
jgi:hypothetical protein